MAVVPASLVVLGQVQVVMTASLVQDNLADLALRVLPGMFVLNPLVFWRSHSPNLSHWAAAAKKILVVHPSSAASEMAFSLLTSTFHDQQSQSLVDYIELSMMLQFKSWSCVYV